MVRLPLAVAKMVISTALPLFSTIASLKGPRPRNQTGSGLIEVIVSLALLGTTGTVFLGAMGTSLKATAVINEQIVSRNLAYSQLEEIRASPYGIAYAVTVSPPAGYFLSIDTETVESNMQKVRVNVFKDDIPLMALEDLKAIQ